MKSNHQARHLLGLNYKLSRQKKVVLEGDEETTINHIPVSYTHLTLPTIA